MASAAAAGAPDVVSSAPGGSGGAAVVAGDVGTAAVAVWARPAPVVSAAAGRPGLSRSSCARRRASPLPTAYIRFIASANSASSWWTVSRWVMHHTMPLRTPEMPEHADSGGVPRHLEAVDQLSA